MAVTAFWFGQAFESAFNSEIDLTSDTLKVMLLTSTAVPDQDVWKYKSDVTNEAAGAGYTAGGETLTGVTVAYTGGTNTWAFDAADTSWAASTITARYAVVYDDTPATDATKPLLLYLNFGEDLSSSNGTFAITWNAAGLATVTVS